MKKLSLLLLLILLISGCSELDSTPTPDIRPSSTSGMVLLQTGVPSQTIIPSTATRYAFATSPNISTIAPTQTPAPTSTRGPTPTVNIYDFSTVTPAAPAECPVWPADPPRPEFVYSYSGDDNPIELVEQTLEYVQAYGPLPVIEALESRGLKQDINYLYRDLTNDGVPEFGFGLCAFRVLGCVDGSFERLYASTRDGHLTAGEIVLVGDENKNGIPEVVLHTATYTMGVRDYQMIEWDGSGFRQILDGISVEIGTDIYYEDLDHDSFKEIIFYQGIPLPNTYMYPFPSRRVKDYYRWDGYLYTLYRRIFDPPVYCFQAVQDGDYLTTFQEYDAALTLYQDAVFSDLLKPWSPELQDFENDTFLSSSGGYPTPYPPPAADPDEYPNLAAYARYRIMLLHVARGYLPEAEIVYTTLQEKFPEGQPGHMFAELAQEFWEEYVLSQNMEQSCSAAIEYAEDHKDTIFYYISSDYHGWQSRNYEPEDICPFK